MARRYLTANRIEFDLVPGAKELPQQDIVLHPAVPASLPAPGMTHLQTTPRNLSRPRSGHPLASPHRVQARQLTNGLSLRLVERHDVPLVTLSLVIRSGETSTPSGKEGLCSLTASLLDEGTRSRSAVEIAGALSDIGASISTSGSLESIEINITTLSPYLEAAIRILADVIVNPAFADPDLERLKRERLATLDSGLNNAETDCVECHAEIALSTPASVRAARAGNKTIRQINNARRCRSVLQEDFCSRKRGARDRRRF